MKNILGLKRVKIATLSVGKSCLVGPYKSSRSVSSVIDRSGDKSHTYTQRQVFMSDPNNGTCYRMWIITRTA